MAQSRGGAAWSRRLRRRQYAEHFTAFGSLYSTGYDIEEVELIRDELVALGIPAGEPFVRRRPQQLSVEEFEHDDSEPPAPMYGPEEQAMTLWADRDGKRSWIPTSELEQHRRGRR